MNLQHIDVRAQTFYTRLNGIKDMLPRQPNVVDQFTIVVAILRRIPMLFVGWIDTKEAFR